MRGVSSGGLSLASAHVLHDQVVEEAVQEGHHQQDAKVLSNVDVLQRIGLQKTTMMNSEVDIEETNNDVNDNTRHSDMIDDNAA